MKYDRCRFRKPVSLLISGLMLHPLISSCATRAPPMVSCGIAVFEGF